MTLRFFRKHKKYGNILLLGALFAMVTFGALATLPSLLERMEQRANAKKPIYELKNYGTGISAPEDWDVKANLRGTGQMQALVLQIRRSNPSLFTDAQLSVLFRYHSPMPDKFVRAGGASPGELSEEALKVAYATAILMKEAEQAGIVVTDDMARAQYRDWSAQIRPELLAGLLRASFFEDKANVVTAELFQHRVLSSIRQEMTLSIYLSSLQGGGRAFSEDVDEIVRQWSESATTDQVKLSFRRYLAGVAEPTEEQIVANFEQYKDKLASETENGFGCKIPDRVRFEYLKVKADVFRDEAEVTDDEIKAYYEAHKDPAFIAVEDKPKDVKAPDAAPDAAPPAEPAEGTPDQTPEAKPAEPATETPAEQPAGEDETANDGGGVEASAVIAQADTGQPEAAGTSEPAAKQEGQATPTQPAATEPQAEPTPAQPAPAGGQAERPKAPEKKFKPLEEVRDEIVKRLKNQKAAEATAKMAEEVYNQLLRHPSLDLENKADEKYVVYNPAGDLLTREQIQMLPNIGMATKPNNDPNAWWPESFSSLVFKIEPLTDKPDVYLNRPQGILTDGTQNAYIFVVKEVQAAHVPESVDEVRDVVIRSLKKEAAYKMAEVEAAEIVALAREKGLKAAVSEKIAASTSAEERVSGLTPKVEEVVVQRPSDMRPSLSSEAVFEAVDAGEEFGTFGDKTLDSVTVFQIKKVRRIQQSDYARGLGEFTFYAIRRQQMELIDKLTDPDRLIAKSGFTKVEKKDENGESTDAEGEGDEDQ